jgi:ABC-type amino acid transport system permease subunit
MGLPAREEKMRRVIGWGVFLVFLGAWIWLSALGVPYIEFSRNWPLLIVAFGVYIIVQRVRRYRRWHRKSASDVITDLESGKIDVDKAVVEIRRSR